MYISRRLTVFDCVCVRSANHPGEENGEVEFEGRGLRPGPTGNRASLSATDDKRMKLWNSTFRRIAASAGTDRDVPGDGWCWIYAVMMNLCLPMQMPDDDELLKRSLVVVKIMKVE